MIRLPALRWSAIGRAVATTALLPLAVAACQTPHRPGNTLDARMDGQFFYSCTNGDRVEMRVAAEAGVAVLIRGEERLEMQRKPTASGFIYQSGQTMMLGNNNQLEINAPGLPTLQCRMEQQETA